MGKRDLRSFLCALGILVSFNAAAQSALDIQIEYNEEEALRKDFLNEHADFACSTSKFYGVDFWDLMYVLDFQLASFSEGERAQRLDQTFMRKMKKNAKLYEDVYKQNREQDRNNANLCKLNQRRDSLNSGSYFSSLGPAQIQVYVGTMIYEEVLCHLGSPPDYKLNVRLAPSGWPLAEDIAKSLFDPQGAIVFLAAEIRFMQDTYKKVANLDLKHEPAMLWQLHNGGSILNRAFIRVKAVREGNPLPLTKIGDKLNSFKRRYASIDCD